MTLSLRSEQAAGIDRLHAGFTAGHAAQMLYGPPGFGKTEIACQLLRDVAQIGGRGAMVLDRIVLCEQTSKRLDKYGISHSVMQSGHWRYRPYERIQVCSAQTLEKRGSFPGLDMLIVDEAHQTREQTKEFIKANPHIKTVGLSGSPFTKGLGQTFTNLVVPVTAAKLVEQGNLVPLRVFLAKEIDMTGVKKVAGEWSSEEASKRGIQITGDVVTEWIAKTNKIFGGPRKTIVFCAGVAHGEDLSRKFAQAGFNFVSVSYKDADEFKADVFKEFAKPDSDIHGLIATDILTKGFDVTDVEIGISARPFSKSFSSHVQQIGRVMRSHPGKEFAVWIDHAGNFQRFAEDWEDVYENGPGTMDDGREKPKPEPTEREKKEAKCPSCSAYMPPSHDTCAHCGYTRVRRNGVVVLPGELEEYMRREKAMKDQKQAFYSGLLWIAKERGYKPGWAFYKFQDKFNAHPKGLRDAPEAPSAEVSRWVQSQFIRAAKGRQAAAA
jgi:superfamily II DNA or RNA helicase